MCDMKTDERLFGFAWSEFEARYGQPQYQFHRADLLGMLQRAVPKSTINLGARCVGCLDDRNLRFDHFRKR